MASLRQKFKNPRRLALDFALLMVGLAIFALAIVLSLQSDLGANSWTVLHHGISLQTPVTLGMAGIIVSLMVLVISWLLGIPPGFGTLANITLIGVWTDVYLEFDLIPKATDLPVQLLMLVGSAVLLGFATALYIKTDFGAGPRDSFMLAITRRTGVRVGLIRWGMEISAVTLGILLGGSFGVGTIVFAILIGPSVDVFFRLFGIQTRSAPPKVAITPAD